MDDARRRPRASPSRAPRSRTAGRDQLGGAGVAGVRLDDDRAAGRERRDRVAARHRERERKVRRAEDGDGPERHEHAADVGARLGLAVGQRRGRCARPTQEPSSIESAKRRTWLTVRARSLSRRGSGSAVSAAARSRSRSPSAEDFLRDRPQELRAARRRRAPRTPRTPAPPRAPRRRCRPGSPRGTRRRARPRSRGSSRGSRRTRS